VTRQSQDNKQEGKKEEQRQRKLRIDKEALKEWRKLPDSVKTRFRKKLREAQVNESPTGQQLRGYPEFYRLKMKRPNYRLVYRWDSSGNIAITVIVVDSREKVYEKMKSRIAKREDE